MSVSCFQLILLTFLCTFGPKIEQNLRQKLLAAEDVPWKVMFAIPQVPIYKFQSSVAP